MIGYYCNTCGQTVRSCSHRDELYFNEPRKVTDKVTVEIPTDMYVGATVRVLVKGNWVVLKRIE